MLETLLLLVGIDRGVLIAGMVGGAISASFMSHAEPSPVWRRLSIGALTGGCIAGFAAEPLSKELHRPEYLQGVALGLGVFGLSFISKVLKAWNEFDLSGTLAKVIEIILGRIK